MKILDKAARLEKALLDRIARRTDIPRHPIEWYRAILDDIEDATEAGPRGTRIFPYNSIVVSVRTVDAHQRATAEAVFAETPSLEQRVRTRLGDRGCAGVEGISVTLKFVSAHSDGVARDYHIEYRRRAQARDAKAAVKRGSSEACELHLTVVTGRATKSRYIFDVDRINVGRLAEVVDSQRRALRQNQVAFLDSADDVNQSVSRAHAHIRFDPAIGEARLHDDGSTHGTRVVRDGRTLAVPRGGARGLKLQEKDEVLLGQARLRVELRPVKRR